LQVDRGGKSLDFNVRPEKPISPPDDSPRLGIIWDGNGKITISHPSAVEQVYSSLASVIETVGAIASPKTQIKPQHLGGAVMILNVYYRLFSAPHGWQLALWFSVILNVNLALINLLPIPVLDGGHILLSVIEGIRRRPISPRIIAVIQNACVVFVIGFMVYLAFFDVQDLVGRAGKDKPVDVKFSPAK